MPGDLAVSSPASFVPTTTTTTVGGSAAAAPPAPARAGEASVGGAAEAGSGKPSLPNPSLRLDSQLGLVVIEFRNDSGMVTESIPTQRQLQAYRDSERTGSNTSAAPVTVQQTASAKQP